MSLIRDSSNTSPMTKTATKQPYIIRSDTCASYRLSLSSMTSARKASASSSVMSCGGVCTFSFDRHRDGLRDRKSFAMGKVVGVRKVRPEGFLQVFSCYPTLMDGNFQHNVNELHEDSNVHFIESITHHVELVAQLTLKKPGLEFCFSHMLRRLGVDDCQTSGCTQCDATMMSKRTSILYRVRR